MTEVKRYSVQPVEVASEMVESVDGFYIAYRDYAALEAKLVDLDQKLAQRNDDYIQLECRYEANVSKLERIEDAARTVADEYGRDKNRLAADVQTDRNVATDVLMDLWSTEAKLAEAQETITDIGAAMSTRLSASLIGVIQADVAKRKAARAAKEPQ